MRHSQLRVNKAKHSDSFFVAVSPPLQSCACWRRLGEKEIYMIDKSKLVGFTATADSAKAIAFYRDKLGLHLVEETPFAIVFDSNGTTLRIQKTEKVVPAPYTLIGWDVENIDETVSELTIKGIEFEKYDQIKQDEVGIWTVPDGSRVAWFKDPDGNLLSLSQSA